MASTPSPSTSSSLQSGVWITTRNHQDRLRLHFERRPEVQDSEQAISLQVEAAAGPSAPATVALLMDDIASVETPDENANAQFFVYMETNGDKAALAVVVENVGEAVVGQAFDGEVAAGEHVNESADYQRIRGELFKYYQRFLEHDRSESQAQQRAPRYISYLNGMNGEIDASNRSPHTQCSNCTNLSMEFPQMAKLP